MADQEIKSVESTASAPAEVKTSKEPAKVTAPVSKRVKNPKRVAAGKALAAKNKEKLAKIKALEEQGKQNEVEAPQAVESRTIEKNEANWPLFVGGGVLVIGGLTAFGYQKWTSAPARITYLPPAEEKKSDPFENF